MGTSKKIYLDASQSVESRLRDLMGRMTLEEKISQLMMLDGRDDMSAAVDQRNLGAVLHVRPSLSDELIDRSLRTRLGIPILIAEDCIHGHSFWKGATIFPTQLALACSWNPGLLERVARATAREVVSTGIHWTFSPVLCLARDLRWGRINETFGEDPVLIGELASAMVRGYQGEGLGDPGGILATAKHYAGYSETQGGRDASEADLSRRKLRSYFLPPFERVAREGCMTFMTGYQSMEGVPSTANRWLLREVLKEKWGFEGILVTDWDNVARLVYEQKICPDMKSAAAVAVKAGNDMMMATPAFYEGALESVKEGLLTGEDIDEPCRRILRLKFRMGLFENPRRSDPQQREQVIHCQSHRELNLEAARQSVVLLKNEQVLPLQAGAVRHLAVIGPNADDALSQLGDWTLGASQHPPSAGAQPRELTRTVVDGLRAVSPEGCRVSYLKGCEVLEDDPSGVEGAAALAARADVAVVVVGDALPLIGEFQSTATLELQGGQIALLDAVARTGTPMIVVLVHSKPCVLPPSAERAAALVECFNPGMMGGQALAEILWGVVAPSGKLTISVPRHVGQQPVYYSQVRGQHGNRYADLTQEPLFAFGDGLSYTTFQYRDLRALTPLLAADQTAGVEITVTNTGARAGDEIVQVYVSDEVTSATWVEQELKAWQRVPLQAGESKQIRFELPYEAFSIVNAAGDRVVEPGDFEIRVGGSSRRREQLATRITVK